MNRFKNQLLMAAGFGLLCSVIGAVTAAPAIAAAVKAALVKNVDERGRTPYQMKFDCVGAGHQCNAAFPAVGMGKRLVVEFVSADINTSSAQNPIVIVSNPTSLATAEFVAARSYDNYFNASQPMVFYFDAGEVPSVSFSSSAGIGGSATITGYVVDLGI